MYNIQTSTELSPLSLHDALPISATLDELAYQVTDTRSKKVINALGVGFKIRNRCLQFTDFFLQHGDSVSIRGTFWQLKLRGLAREVRVCVLVLGLRYVLL